MSRQTMSCLFGSLALAATLAAPSISFAQSKGISDAQVEANVLKAFASDNRLANQAINTSTVFGTVTLSGSVTNDAARDAAEQIASRTDGVKKVVDQLTVGAAPATAAAAQGNDYDPAAANSLPSNGAAVSAAQGASQAAQQQYDPNNGNQAPGAYSQQGQYSGQQQQQPMYGQGGDSGVYPQQGGVYPPQQGVYPQQGGYGQQGYPQQQGGYPPQGSPDQQGGYAQQPGGYPPPPPQGRLYRRDYERQMAQGGYGQQGAYAQPQGQPGGQVVTIAPGTDLGVRINRWLSSGDAVPGSNFTALVNNDVLTAGQIAIPRGATVEGTVVDAKEAGALKGRGRLTLQLTALDLGGQRIPLQSDTFTVSGRDKAAQSVGSTILGAGVGALIGGAIGRGTGAAVGAGVGGAAGLAGSAASGGGNAALPPEALLHFHLTAPTQVTTVSEAEMQRLGGYAGPASAYRGGYGPGPYARPYPYAYPRGYYPY